MSLHHSSLISRRRALTFAACLGLYALAGCGNSEEGMQPKLTKSKRELMGDPDAVTTPGKKRARGPGR